MGLLDGFEKLINEHGSAAILKERIELANDKYAVLEDKNKVLHSENEALRLDNGKLKEQVRSLEERHTSFHGDDLLLKYGVYWDKNGNPFCPTCKTPTSQIKWATYINQQIHGLKCSCTDKPFVLMDNGEPIHAQEAMKRMAIPT